MRRKTTEAGRTKDIAGVVVLCDRTMHQVIWDVAQILTEARETFGLTDDWMAHHTPIRAIYDEKNQLLTLQILAPKKHKQAINSPKT